MHKDPPLDDVAIKAEVSKSTVSQILNETAKISAKTRAKELSAVHELGYESNNIARSLTKRRTYTIGVVLEDEIRLTRMLIRYKVDGLLITSVKSDSQVVELLKLRKIPFFIISPLRS